MYVHHAAFCELNASDMLCVYTLSSCILGLSLFVLSSAICAAVDEDQKPCAAAHYLGVSHASETSVVSLLADFASALYYTPGCRVKGRHSHGLAVFNTP